MGANPVQVPTTDGPKPLDYSVIGEPLNTLLKAVGHKLSREWPSKYAEVTALASPSHRSVG